MGDELRAALAERQFQDLDTKSERLMIVFNSPEAAERARAAIAAVERATPIVSAFEPV